jgi:hypothetical protein
MSEKHLFKFQQENDYRIAKYNHLVVPNISTIVETGNTYITSDFVTRELAQAGDIIVYHEEENGEKTVRYMKPEAYQENGYWIPDAIVVVPCSHTEDGTIRAMGIYNASCTAPNNGTAEGENIIWGNNIDIDGLKQYQGFTVFSSIEGQTSQDTFGLSDIGNSEKHTDFATDSEFAHIKNQTQPSTQNPFDLETAYAYRSTYSEIAPSPYNNDNTPNEAYHSKGDFSVITNNVLQDMDGAGNTLKILKMLSQSYLNETLFKETLDNENTKTIVVDSSEITLDLFPAASACARYSSVLKPSTFDASKTLEENIKTMPWYLPSAGELGYFVARSARINYARQKIYQTQSPQLIGGSSLVRTENASSSIQDYNIFASNTEIYIGQKYLEIPFSVAPFCKF